MSGLVLLVNLVVWGAHALLPFRLAETGSPAARRAWALAALPALGASVIATAFGLGRDPEPAVAWGLHELAAGSRSALVVALAVGAAALADLLGLAGWRRLEPAAWRAWGCLGALALLAVTWGSELVRIGWGPVAGLGAVVGATLLRLPLALAAAETLAGEPRWAAPLAGLALPTAVALWPAELRAALGLDWLTLGAAVALLVVARWLPARLRRAAVAAGVLLAVLLLDRAGTISQALGTVERGLPLGGIAP